MSVVNVAQTTLTTASKSFRLIKTVAARPSNETPWVAMRRALDPRLEEIAAGGEHVRRLARLIVNTPALAARHRD